MTSADYLFRQFQIQKFDVRRLVPAVSMTVEVDVTRLMQLRRELNASRAKEKHLTVTHLVNKAACDVVIDFPILYASFNGKEIIPGPHLILNVPVDVDNHVEYLVIHHPNTKSLDELAAEFAAELGRIQRGEGRFRQYVQSLMRIPPWLRRFVSRMPGRDIHFLQTRYGNFPISNFGSFGIDRGVVAIARPMIASLCFGRLSEKVIVKDDSYASIQTLAISLTFDHRAVDGGYAGRYLSSLKQRLEAPDQLLAIQ